MTRLINADMLKKQLEETKDEYFGLYQAIKAIDNAPTVPQVVVFTESTEEKAVSDLKVELQNIIKTRLQGEWVDFAKFVAEWVVNDNFFEENADIFAELACRKLTKLGIVEIDGDTYKLKEEKEE